MKKLLTYWKYLRQHKRPFYAALFFAAVYGISNGAGIPLMLKLVIPLIFQGNALPWQVIFMVASLLPIIMTIRALSAYYNTYLIQYCGIRVIESVRMELFRKLQYLSLPFMQKHNQGDLLARVTTDTEKLLVTITNVSNDLFKQPISLVGSIGFVGYMATKQTDVLYVLAGLAVIPISVLPIRFLGKKVLQKAKRRQAQVSDMTSQLSENLSAVREVRSFGLEEKEIATFSQRVHNFFFSQLRVVRYQQVLSPSIEVMASLGIGLTIFIAGMKEVQAQDIIALVSALYLTYEPVKKLGNMHNSIQEGTASIERIEYLLDQPDETSDDSLPALQVKQGAVSYREVSFSYGAEPALSEFTLDVQAGEVIALVGPSGAGKTTFINLLPRFYEIQSGQILIDGQDITQVSRASLRRHISIVSQEPVLFNESIRENLLRGRSSATEEELIAAAKDAQIHDFIQALPNGYDTIVGERATRLSGGQKQRIAVARAFLKQAPILILDEATSALDAESEANIQTALTKLVAGKTVFIIAHRFSSIKLATRIVVFQKGVLHAQGTHEDLLQRDPLYRGLYEAQS